MKFILNRPISEEVNIIVMITRRIHLKIHKAKCHSPKKMYTYITGNSVKAQIKIGKIKC